MTQLRQLLVEELQGLLDAESQLTEALPEMANAARHPKLKEAFEIHLTQTEEHVRRLREIFEALGETPAAQPCKAMTGLVAEGTEMIQRGNSKEPLAADLALIAAAQKVEHYEISAYGTARGLARQLGEMRCARLLSHTLGEEETTDFLLTAISDPLIQQLSLEDAGGDVNLETVNAESSERRSAARTTKGKKQERVAS